MNRAALVFVFLIISGGVIAQETASIDLSELASVESTIRASTNAWFTPLQELAEQTLLALAVAGLAWRLIPAVVQGANAGEIIWIVVQQIMIVGLFLAFIRNAPEWTTLVIDSFKEAAGRAFVDASNLELTASGMLEKGVDTYKRMVDSQSNWLAGINPAMHLLGLVAVLMYAFIGGFVLLVTAEVYVVTAAGVIFLGFAGLEWSADAARRYILYVLSVGAKLYGLLLSVAIGDRVITEWALGNDAILQGVAVIGGLFMMAMIVTTLPNMIQGIVNGSSIGSGGPSLTGMVAGAASVAAGTVMKTLAAGSAVSSAAGLTAAQAGAGSVGEALKGGGMKGAANFVSKTARNLAGAAGESAVAKATGGKVSMTEALKGRRSSALAALIDSPPSAMRGSVGPGSAESSKNE